MATSTVKLDKSEQDDFIDLKLAPGNVFVLTFTGTGKHLLDPTSIAAIHKALDLVENSTAGALVTTNEGRYFSNGMDVNFGGTDVDEREAYIQQCQNLLRRILVFPIPTIAAIRGHGVGAGFMFALAHDYRFMQSNQGMLFVNEIDLGLILTPGNSTLIGCKLTATTFHEAILTGHRYSGNDAAIVGLVHATFSNAESTLEASIKKGTQLASKKWKRDAYQGMKKQIFKVAIRELEAGGLGFAKL